MAATSPRRPAVHLIPPPFDSVFVGRRLSRRQGGAVRGGVVREADWIKLGHDDPVSAEREGVARDAAYVVEWDDGQREVMKEADIKPMLTQTFAEEEWLHPVLAYLQKRQWEGAQQPLEILEGLAAAEAKAAEKAAAAGKNRAAAAEKRRAKAAEKKQAAAAAAAKKGQGKESKQPGAEGKGRKRAAAAPPAAKRAAKKAAGGKAAAVKTGAAAFKLQNLEQMLAAKHGATAKGTSHSSGPSSADPSSGAGPCGQQQQTGTSLRTSHAAAAAQLEPSPAGRGGDAAGAAPGGVGAAARKRAKHTLSPAAAKHSRKQQQQAAAEAEEAEAPMVFELPAGPPLPLPRVEVVPVEQLDLSQQKNLRTITVGRAVLYQYNLREGPDGVMYRVYSRSIILPDLCCGRAGDRPCAEWKAEQQPDVDYDLEVVLAQRSNTFLVKFGGFELDLSEAEGNWMTKSGFSSGKETLSDWHAFGKATAERWRALFT